MAKKSTRRRSQSKTMVFERRNYILLAVGVILVAVGFSLMRIENEFLGTISLYVAPLMILGGYAEIAYAILWRPSDEDDADETE